MAEREIWWERPKLPLQALPTIMAPRQLEDSIIISIITTETLLAKRFSETILPAHGSSHLVRQRAAAIAQGIPGTLYGRASQTQFPAQSQQLFVLPSDYCRELARLSQRTV
eukprot:816100-Prorocentrum_minimum.AAC.3